MKLSNNLSFESALQSYETKYNCKYHEYQKKQLEFGHEDNLDISMYANPAFDDIQMTYIRNGLEKNLGAHRYAFVEYNRFLMEVIYRLLEVGEQFDKYVNGDYLDVDTLINDYALLCKRTNLMPLDKWGEYNILDHAPYRVHCKGDSHETLK